MKRLKAGDNNRTAGDLKDEGIGEMFAQYPTQFAEIAKATGDMAGFAFESLPDGNLKELFAQYPDEFVAIAKATGKVAYAAFQALQNESVGKLLAENPKLLIRNFADMARNFSDADVFDGETVAVFAALRNKSVGKLFVENFELLKTRFAEIAKAAGEEAGMALESLRIESVGKLFVQYPNEFVELAKAVGRGACIVFSALDDEGVRKMFVENFELLKTSLANIAKASSPFANWRMHYYVFNFLKDKDSRDLFLHYPNEFVAIAQGAGRGVGMAFYALQDESIAKRFKDYCDGKVTFDGFMLPVLSIPEIAIELGRPIDELHEDTPDRMKFLNSLSTLQVFSLLISNPELFYTSSNHLMFDRLKKDLGNTSITDFFKKYDLIGTEWYRNFIFRAINYDRFYGEPDSMFKEADLNSAVDAIFSPLAAEKFDETYFFLIANGLVDKIMQIPIIKQDLVGRISGRLKELHAKTELTDDEKQITSALEYLAYAWDSKTLLVSEQKKSDIRKLEEKGFYVPSNYSIDDKLQVMQIFVMEDTKDYDWGATQEWFARYATPKKGEDGELIYETKDARVILFAGKNKEQSQEFVKQQLEKNPNMIITFRGHSYHLEVYFPPDIFANRKAHPYSSFRAVAEAPGALPLIFRKTRTLT